MRTLGNIRLIAELFKKSVVPEKIVLVCVQDLMGDPKQEPSENNVEVCSFAYTCYTTSAVQREERCSHESSLRQTLQGVVDMYASNKPLAMGFSWPSYITVAATNHSPLTQFCTQHLKHALSYL